MAESGAVFPPKTSKHTFGMQLPEVLTDVPLDRMMRSHSYPPPNEWTA